MLRAEDVRAEALLALDTCYCADMDRLASARDDYAIFVPASAALEDVSGLLDTWLAEPDFTCCTLQVGIELTFDEKSWTDRTTDHFWHQNGWFHVLAEVASGEDGSTSGTFVWDESSLVVQRAGARLILSDTRWEAFQTSFAWHPISVPALPLIDAVLEAGGVLERLRAAVTRELAVRGMGADEWRALLPNASDKPRFSPSEGRKRLAVIAREMENGALRDLPRLASARQSIDRLDSRS